MHQTGETQAFILSCRCTYSVKSTQCLLLPLRTGRRRSFQNFPLVTVLPSGTSAAVLGNPALFGSFSGTMLVSDFSVAYVLGLWPQAFPNRPGVLFCLPKTSEISRFSSIERPRMHRFLDSAGSMHDSLVNVVTSCCLPLRTTGSAPRKGDFGAQ